MGEWVSGCGGILDAHVAVEGGRDGIAQGYNPLSHLDGGGCLT